MNITDAINAAKRNVQIVGYGRQQWVVNVYSPKHRAWMQSQTMQHRQAINACKENRIEAALALLGYNPDDARAHAYEAARHAGGWVDCLRDVVRNSGAKAEGAAQANARLIAAAPELLEAARVALGHLTCGMDGDWRGEDDPREILRAAIAKAEGAGQ